MKFKNVNIRLKLNIVYSLESIDTFFVSDCSVDSD